MLQILQNIKNGKTTLEDLPAPNLSKGSILIKTTDSLVSLGTERMLVEFSKSNIIQKARQQPDRVKQAMEKIKKEGLLPTLETIFNKLDQPIPLGYCNVGEVIGLADDVSEFSLGDRVASNGPHAEIVCVPKNLAVKIPKSVSNEEASFTVIGSIGLQGIRLLKPTMGETIVVYGLGLIGLITAQLLKINGCNVIGIDLDDSKCQLAEKLGIDSMNPKKDDPVDYVNNKTKNNGCDGVIITASSTSNEIISKSANMCRKQGRIVLVGVIGLQIDRAEFYEKELTFQVSCSYGPGRYDFYYEQNGLDYPLPYVRWTEKRNFETILEAIDKFDLNVKELISEKVKLNDYEEIYNNISSKKAIATIITYPKKINKNKKIQIKVKNRFLAKNVKSFGIIGAGNFTKTTMLPSLKKLGAIPKYIASSGGVNGTFLAKKYNIQNSTSDYKNILNDQNIDSVMITTRHNTHSNFVIESLKSNKNVFVEKPLGISKKEIDSIVATIAETGNSNLTLGFNRRFSPHSIKIDNLLGSNRDSLNIIATMNAGYIEKNHWVNDLNIGGGRIVGEACHLIDLCIFFAKSKIKSICMNSLGNDQNRDTDNASILLKFENGSNAVINYFSNGSSKYSKERVEIHSQQKTFILDNFQTTKGFGVKGFKSYKSKIDKGHMGLLSSFLNNSKTKKPVIPLEDILNASYASLAAIESCSLNDWVEVEEGFILN